MPTIGTHDGYFHCDEIFAVFLLKQLPEYKEASVVRTRDPEILSECDVVVDVGQVYDPVTKRYDHHQKDFNITWNDFYKRKYSSVKLSSAGLVYAHFGKRVVSLLTGWDIDDDALDKVYHKVYQLFVMEIDGIDNGIPITAKATKYRINTGLSERVKNLNPWWNHAEKDTQNGFDRALQLVGGEFLEKVEFFSKCWWPARQIVSRAIETRESVDPSKHIILLEQSCPWKGHVLDLEEEADASQLAYPQPTRSSTNRPEVKPPVYILFVVLPNDNGTWIVQTVPKDTFKPRLSFPDSWLALQAEELCAVADIEGCIYVHNKGHVGGNKTKEGAIEMARSVVTAWLAKENPPPSPPPPPVFSRGSRGNQQRLSRNYRGARGDRPGTLRS